MPSSDVAIYLPFASGFYSQSFGRAGGAERQMVLLAMTLALRGVRVAHVVYPVADPIDTLPAGLRLVHRGGYAGDRRFVGGMLEAIRILRALEAADGRVVVVRTGTPVVGIVALYCRVRRRRLVFSAANDSDFLPGKHEEKPLGRALYRLGLRLADMIVVQSRDQLELARANFPSLRRFTWIPSFAEAAIPAAAQSASPDTFLWISRIRDHKQPLLFVRLASALPDLRFVMVGTLTEGYGSEARRIHAELQEASERLPNFELRDPMPHVQLGETIARSIAVVSTSRLEGMPNVFLEAWSRGVPALTLTIDPDNAIAEHRLGISAHDDWDAFVAGARELADGRDDRADLAERVRRYVQETHSLDVIAERWRSLVEELAS